MVVALANRPAPRVDVDDEQIHALAELGRCDSCRRVDQPLVAVTINQRRFEVCGPCIP